MTEQQREMEKLLADISKYFPKFFDDFSRWEYANGTNAGKDFKRIFNRAKKLQKLVSSTSGKD